METQKIKGALLSVYYKDGLEPLARLLHQQGVTLYSTGGTESFLKGLGLPVTPVESLTGYPEIFGGRVKTLHPAIFGGILYRRDLEGDLNQAATHHIQPIDMVVVDLYPFEATVASKAPAEDIIEKIDIGGISLLRAAAKNFKDVLVVSSRQQYEAVYTLLSEQEAATTQAQRQYYAAAAFAETAHYDTAIFNYYNQQAGLNELRVSVKGGSALRYGENPHQRGWFYGNLEEQLEKLHGKELSYNNLVDVEGALQLVAEFEQEAPVQVAFAIIKHTNACGIALASNTGAAYKKAFDADPVSAFGGILATTGIVDLPAAEAMNTLFFEVLLAPDYTPEALALLQSKKNRILLKIKHFGQQKTLVKTALNGFLAMDADTQAESAEHFKVVTEKAPTTLEIGDLTFAIRVAKHTKSNTIVLAKEGRLLASGVGQTSRVDALEQAIAKAQKFGFSLQGAVMASDAFFPFPDCVEIAAAAGISAIAQPGGSIKDADSISAANQLGIAMVLTGVRHFKH